MHARSCGACGSGPLNRPPGDAAVPVVVIDLSPDEIAAGCGARLVAGDPGRVRPDDVPGRAVADSRKVGPGDLFVGLEGARADGGRFAEQAIAAGAWGVLVSEPHAGRVADGAAPARVLAAGDPLASLGRLARVWRDRLGEGGCRVVAITGSTGKTSTKDILRALLSAPLESRVHASRENYNTEVGLPLAILEAEPATRVLVLEMGMRGPGQIAELCGIARPAVGVITNIGPVHLELVGTVEAVAATKAELIAALPADGACVIPAGVEVLRPHLRRELETITFAAWPPGEGTDAPGVVETASGRIADIRVLSAGPLDRGQPGLRCELAAGSEHAALEFNFRQAYNLTNALAAIGAAHVLGISIGALKEGAGRVEISDLRGEEIELRDGVLVINDCYNANPMSMRAALDHLAEVAAARGSPRTVAVLGEMAELGPGAPAFHRRIGEHAARRGVGLLIAVGAGAPPYAEGFGDAGELRSVDDASGAAAIVEQVIEPEDCVLVKGSRSVALEHVAERMQEVERRGAR